MATRNPVFPFRLPVAVIVTVGLLAACSKPAEPPEPTPPASPTGDAPAPTVPPPASEQTPVPPADAPAGPAQPAPDAPPPADSSPAPQPTSLDRGPALEAMQAARTNSKIGVPVDLRYRFEGDAMAGHPVQLHLAAVPRVEAANLRISVQNSEGLALSEGTLNVQKASPSGVYRKQLAVTRQAEGPREIRVLVTLGVGEGSGHGFYYIPLDSGAVAQKQVSVKQH